jgi:hypothetical protein
MDQVIEKMRSALTEFFTDAELTQMDADQVLAEYKAHYYSFEDHEAE